jgi:prepilin-type processing-associated H-X9-DG protein
MSDPNSDVIAGAAGCVRPVLDTKVEDSSRHSAQQCSRVLSLRVTRDLTRSQVPMNIPGETVMYRLNDRKRPNHPVVLAIGLALAAFVGVGISVAAADKDAPRDAASERVRRMRSANNLKQLGLAMHIYHDSKGSFPPAAVFDKDGTPLLSWRVLLLPYLDQKKLSEEFHLDEAWDSAHNKKLLERMPKVYEIDADSKKTGETVYLAFTGNGAVFEGKKGIPITDITDGTSNTLMFVESARAVPWTKPEDLPYDAAKALPKLGTAATGFNAAFCDGSVRFINSKTPEKTIRSLITRNGGEILPDKF